MKLCDTVLVAHSLFKSSLKLQSNGSPETDLLHHYLLSNLKYLNSSLQIHHRQDYKNYFLDYLIPFKSLPINNASPTKQPSLAMGEAARTKYN